ncbi:hypothetical protein Cpin_5996 [Chitinophaga pinensis DSM 2588]|uniref:Uncharacterized protein n=1 Tax=Chitinophaga pinensis (strain ATCC 43595 / DSM 2588 / LMG 13176 / NBRC 15968 / NCIMB 11800 / UQM 2034) TaxID=485918 RepID=A0A979H0G2_CHIPD|nr:hypothetical protein Cpin_5996 [Chitinophaga pinensis DSM 2588]
MFVYLVLSANIFEWNLDGNLLTTRQYSTAGAVIENHEYDGGKLYRWQGRSSGRYQLQWMIMNVTN